MNDQSGSGTGTTDDVFRATSSPLFRHRVWTRSGERYVGIGSTYSISESSDYVSETSSSGTGEFPSESRPQAPIDQVATEQDAANAQSTSAARLLNAVACYWDAVPTSQRSAGGMNSIGKGTPALAFACALVDSTSGGKGRVTDSEARLATTGKSQPGDASDAVPAGDEAFDHIKLISYSDSAPPPVVTAPTNAPPSIPPFMDSALSLCAGTLDLRWLETFDAASLESLVPRDPLSGRPLTIGSLVHGEGKCKPCIFFHRAKCFKGVKCQYCHFNHSHHERATSNPAADPLAFLQAGMARPGVATLPPAVAGAGGRPPGSRRLRPSKRTREMLKQINAHPIDEPEDPHGPALTAASLYAPRVNSSPPLGQLRAPAAPPSTFVQQQLMAQQQYAYHQSLANFR